MVNIKEKFIPKIELEELLEEVEAINQKCKEMGWF